MNDLAKVFSKMIALSLLWSSLGLIEAAGQDSTLQPVPETSTQLEQVLKVYTLRNADGELVRSVLDQIYGDQLAASGARVAVDNNTNSIIAVSDDKTHQQILTLVERLDIPDQPAPAKPGSPINLVVQLIMDGGDAGASIPLATPVSARVQEILVEAGDSGLIRHMAKPHVVIHSLIRVNPGAPHSQEGRVATGSSAVEGNINLNLNGVLHQLDDDYFQLNTKIQIALQPDQSGASENARKKATAEIQTDTTIQKNHPVLLSVNTIEGRSFLIMVEIR